MKYKLLLVISCISSVFGCINTNNSKKTCIESGTNVKLKVNSCEKVTGKLAISYSIENMTDQNIWICDGINHIGKCDISIENNYLLLRLFTHIPGTNNILLEVWPSAFYSLLSANSTAQRKIEIELPIKALSPFCRKKIPFWGFAASELVIQVGYITSDGLKNLESSTLVKPLWHSQEAFTIPVLGDYNEIANEIILEERISGVNISVQR